MDPVSSGNIELNKCDACGAVWFDKGEIRELIEGRFPKADEPQESLLGEFAEEGLERGQRSGIPVPGFGELTGRVLTGDLAAGLEEKTAQETPQETEQDRPFCKKGRLSNRMSCAWEKCAAISCPRCSKSFSATDFRNTGVPVFYCRGCGGTLVSQDSIRDLSQKLEFHRKHAGLYQAVGESMASSIKKQHAAQKAGSADIKAIASAIPVVVPLKVESEGSGSLPVIKYGLIAVMVAAWLSGFFGIAGMDVYQAGLALPSGVGYVSSPFSVLVPSLFFHGATVGGGILLLINCFFLWVLGDNLEERMGHVPFLIFFIVCGIVAGAAHLIWGKAGASPALGSAGAVAGVLGAYIVFFPHVPIKAYRVGEIVTMPAYFFACAWVIAQFLLAYMPFFSYFYSYSLMGSFSGLAAGAAVALLWRTFDPHAEEKD